MASGIAITPVGTPLGSGRWGHRPYDDGALYISTLHSSLSLYYKGKAERGRAPFGYLWGKCGDQKI